MSIKLVHSGDKGFNPGQIPAGSGRWLVDLRSSQPGHWVAWLDDKGECLAAAQVIRAEESAFHELSKLPTARLDQSIALEAVWLGAGNEAADLLPALLYTALRVGRVWGRLSVVAYAENAETPVTQIARLAPLSRATAVSVKGKELSPVAQLLEVSLHHAASRCSPAVWASVQPTLADEVVDTVQHWIPQFWSGPWVQSILNGTISREQYLACLKNMHRYVRQTTRHLARAIAHSEDRRLRNHFIEHLKGEINHELSIERDLKQLGVDPEYVIEHSVPSTATREFMAVQESAIGFYQDPVILMACPLAAEGVTAHIDDHFLDILAKTVGSWGVEKPERAIGFLHSHTHTDGGDDGHWQMTVDMLRHYLKDEDMQRRFLSTLAAARDTIERSFNSSVDELKLFSTTL